MQLVKTLGENCSTQSTYIRNRTYLKTETVGLGAEGPGTGNVPREDGIEIITETPKSAKNEGQQLSR